MAKKRTSRPRRNAGTSSPAHQVRERMESASECAENALKYLKLSQRDRSYYSSALNWWVSGWRHLGEAAATVRLTADGSAAHRELDKAEQEMEKLYREQIDPAFGLIAD